MRKGRTVFWIVLLTLWAVQMSFPQEKITLTLEESIRLALSQNPYHLANEERVETAKAHIREAASGFLPSLNAQGLHTLDEKLFELEFPDPLTGQPQRISMDFTRDYQFSLSLSLPLFTSGRLTSGFKQAKYNFLSTEEAARQSEHTTVFNAKAAFYGIFLAKEFIRVAEEAVEDAEKHFTNVKRLYELGMASKFDLIRTEVRVANLKPELIASKNNLRIAELNLKTLLYIDLSQPIEIKGELKFEDVKPELDGCITRALANRPEISQLRYQKNMAGEMLKLVRASALPSLAVSGTYNYWADQFNFGEDNWQNYYTVNLALTIPLFNGFSASARVAQSKSMIRELDLNMKGIVDMVEFEVREALLKLDEAKETLLSQEKNVEQAQESLRIAELSFSEGMVTTLDVSAAQIALSQAKINHSRALYDYVISLAQLDKAMGVDWKD